MNEAAWQTVSEVIRSRRSVRAFKPEPVPRPVLEAIFDLAQTAPSNCNTQPWVVHVASGAACERLRERITAASAEGRMPTWDFVYDFGYEGVYRERQYGAAAALYGAMGIQREERDKRDAAFQRNFCFFDAPHVAFLFLPGAFGIREAADLGMYAQNLMLSIRARGLASCPQTALSFWPDIVRETLGIDEDMKLLFGISFGYEDTECPANRTRTDRAPVAEAVTFHDE